MLRIFSDYRRSKAVRLNSLMIEIYQISNLKSLTEVLSLKIFEIFLFTSQGASSSDMRCKRLKSKHLFFGFPFQMFYDKSLVSNDLITEVN